MHIIVIDEAGYLKESGKHEITTSLNEARFFPTKKQGERALSRLKNKSVLTFTNAYLILKPKT